MTLLKCLITGAVALAATFGAAFVALAQTVEESLNEPAREIGSEIAPSRQLENLEPFIDGVIGGLQKSYNVAGVTLAVVYDGEIALTKGYGFADADGLRPVDADITLFRPGSVSKLFTWTAIMQLVEQGKLDLDTDVNTYLTQFQIPDTFDAPVTLRHIMSHTAGFEDGGIGYLYADGVDDLMPVSEFLEKHMPARVRSPGTYAAYSNWATALAGLIVANQSGVDFDTYMEENIFQPLGMRYSTFREPVPDNLANHLSESLSWRSGKYLDVGFEYIHNLAGAGSMSSTAGDMARFMLAHLGDGSYQGGRILSADATRRMREPLHRHHESTNAMLHGFFEQTHNGRFAYGHSGSTAIFHTRMSLLPEEGIGIFISTNAPGGRRIVSAFESAFFDRYLPRAEGDAFISNGANPEARQIARDSAGAYRTTRRSYSDYQKAAALFTGDRFIRATADGGIDVGGSRYIPSGINRFTSISNPDHSIAFGRAEDGAVNAMFVGSNSGAAAASEKIGFWDQARTHQRILGLGLLISIGVLLGVIRLVPKWHRMTLGERVARGLVLGASAAYVTGFVLLMLSLIGGLVAIYRDGVDNLYLILTLWFIGAALALAAFAMMGVAWVRGYWSLFGRLRHTVVVIGLIAMAWSLHFWNLIGPWNA